MEIAKIQEQIKEIEQEIKKLPYHKGTEHHIGKLKAKLAKLREDASIKTTEANGAGAGFAIKKQGDATVVLVGLPSVGKSTLLNKLTGAKSKVASYPFTTLTVIPGIMRYKGAKIQILDVPGLIQGASVGKGRGKEVLSVIRIADLILMVASIKNPSSFDLIEKELYLAGVRVDQKKPDISIEKKLKGGIRVYNKPKNLSEKTIKSLAQDFGILNAEIKFGEQTTQDRFIDALIGNRVYAPSLKVLLKGDLLNRRCGLKWRSHLLVSAKNNTGIKKLKQTIFKNLNLIRVYLKESAGAEPKKQPLICKGKTTVFQAAQKISHELAKEIKGAKIWGPSAQHKSQFVGPTHALKDKDAIFFVKR